MITEHRRFSCLGLRDSSTASDDGNHHQQFNQCEARRRAATPSEVGVQRGYRTRKCVPHRLIPPVAKCRTGYPLGANGSMYDRLSSLSFGGRNARTSGAESDRCRRHRYCQTPTAWRASRHHLRRPFATSGSQSPWLWGPQYTILSLEAITDALEVRSAEGTIVRPVAQESWK